MKLEYITHMGSDLMVANAARVSMNKWKTKLDEKDIKLIKYLTEHKHTSPFRHPQLQVRVTVPIFIARQLHKHIIGMNITLDQFAQNEVSRRYVDDIPEFYTPKEWRKRPDKSIKQGSSDETIADILINSDDGNYKYSIEQTYKSLLNQTEDFYHDLINTGVAPEMARMILPQAAYTSWIWTGSLHAWLNLYALRIDSHAQKEVQEIAKQLGEILQEHFPYSFEAWTTK